MLNLKVAVVAYSRPEKSIATLKFLRDIPISCVLFVDGSVNTQQAAGQEDIKACAKKLEIPYIHQDSNLGLRDHIFFAADYMSGICDYFLILEDDLHIEARFLKFLQRDVWRNVYNSCPSVTFGCPDWFSEPDFLVFRTKIFVPWGVIITSRFWAIFKERRSEIICRIKELENKGKVAEFVLERFLNDQEQYIERPDIWSIYWHAYWLLENRCLGVSSRALVSNSGVGENGVHRQCKEGIVANLWVGRFDPNTRVSVKTDSVVEDNVSAAFCRYWANSYTGVN